MGGQPSSGVAGLTIADSSLATPVLAPLGQKRDEKGRC
jgi:hypothetical protein